MANTTPDNIYYPLVTDVMTGLETRFASLATSVQNAFNSVYTNMGTRRVASASARDAAYPTPTAGQRVYRTDLRYEQVYIDSTFGWKGYGGLVPVRPTSVVNTGTVIGTDGVITMTNSPGIIVNGTFTADFDEYIIKVRIWGVDNSALALRFATGGTVDVSSNYVYNGTAVSSNTASTVGAWSGLQTYIDTGRLGASLDLSCVVEIRISAPAIAAQRTRYMWQSHSITSIAGTAIAATGVLNPQAAHDGFQFSATSGNINGTIQVFGYGRTA